MMDHGRKEAGDSGRRSGRKLVWKKMLDALTGILAPGPARTRTMVEESDRRAGARCSVVTLIILATAIASSCPSPHPIHTCSQRRSHTALRLRGGRPKREQDPDVLLDKILHSVIKKNVEAAVCHGMCAKHMRQVTSRTSLRELMRSAEEDRDPIKTAFNEERKFKHDQSKICYRSLSWKLVRKSVLCITIEDDYTRQEVINSCMGRRLIAVGLLPDHGCKR
eukprot:766865-Hanusia_phi.AAC.9